MNNKMIMKTIFGDFVF